MLETIKELLPLLEGVKDGTVWLVGAYFGVWVLRILVTGGVILVVVYIMFTFFSKWMTLEYEKENRDKVKDKQAIYHDKFTYGGRTYELMSRPDKLAILFAAMKRYSAANVKCENSFRNAGGVYETDIMLTADTLNDLSERLEANEHEEPKDDT